MKIFAINNYDLEWQDKNKNEVPRHQSWGIDYLRQKGNIVDTTIYKIPATFKILFGKFEVPAYNLFFALLFLFSGKGFKYDVVISFCSPTLTFFSFFKKIKLIKARLYTVIHHGGVSNFSLQGMTKSLFLSREIKKTYPNYNNATAISWNADLEFYKATFEEMQQTKDHRFANPHLVSTGKSYRDDLLLKSACQKLNVPLHVFDNQESTDGLIHTHSRQGYVKMINIMKGCSINVVACKNNPDKSNSYLCGLTSILDGIALGMPLIYSNNCNLPFDPEIEGFGLCYKAENEDDLTQTIKKLILQPKLMEMMSQKAINFAESNNYTHYCSALEKIISHE